MLDDGSISFDVIDQGTGMSEEKLKMLQEQFAQPDFDWSRTNDGIGLGLTIARAFLELHDGVLAIESKSDRGTKVSLILPKERVL